MRIGLSFLCLISFGCGPAPIDPLVIEPGVRREVFLVEGPRPPPNPSTGGETPAEEIIGRPTRIVWPLSHWRAIEGAVPPPPLAR